MTDIRVGLIRCDTHGMWFGPQMQDHDPVLFERPLCYEDDRDPHYTWMTRGCHYFFYTHYSSPRRMTAPRVDGFRIVKLWDENREAAELAARIFRDVPVVCDNFEQVSDDVDLVFIADCNGDGSDHLKLARPGLEKGVATFIDKPFAHCSEDVKAITGLAAAHDAPVMSLSILQTNPAAGRIRARFDELGETEFGSVTCANTHPAALIHGICTALHVFGDGVRRVTALHTERHADIHLDYGTREDRPTHGVTIHCGVARFRFTEMFVQAFGPEGAVQGLALNDFNASEGSAEILRRVRDMVRTGRADALSNQMIHAVAIMDAARTAQSTGKSTDVIGAEHT